MGNRKMQNGPVRPQSNKMDKSRIRPATLLGVIAASRRKAHRARNHCDWLMPLLISRVFGSAR